ncbi:sulfotransferase domain-containing protein [Mariniblastus fucicola]|uniref:Sulfotransferase domain protein n=1 Tax=Mariniblastus fucicola TaxID=980251 RepID=A0A5B9P6V1_9BACT|nr:sulfotransferase domain-containing protein [Mariniblastus fucicola]QEG20732.1 Sulfotransferase domain protein [Mariniblastus fucicola]
MVGVPLVSGRTYFCIRGYMKSGTNWVCRLLNLHPDIHSSGEFHWWKYFETYNENNRVFQNLANQEKEDAIVRRGLEKMTLETLDYLAPAHAKFVGDRTPHTLHPIVIRNAPHISIVRDCRDIIVSRMFHYFNFPNISNYFRRYPARENIRKQFVKDPWFFHQSPDLLLADESFVRQTARQWKQYLVADRNTMKCHPKLPVKLVKYENLHEDLQGKAEALVSFLGADPSKLPQIPSHLMPGHREEKPNSFNRKGVVGDWMNYINPEVAGWIHDEAGDELIHQGYVESKAWITRVTPAQPEQVRANRAA